MNPSLIEGKSAIVSGGSAGLGLAITRRLIRDGYRVTVLGRDADRLSTLRSSMIKDAVSEDHLQVIPTDATSRSEVDAALDFHLKTFGRLDVLVNVVGHSDRGLIEKLEPNRLIELFNANVISALTCGQACLPALRENAAEKRNSVIVNIGSLASHVAPAYLGGYVIVKHALAGLTRQMRLECERDGVHVGLVSPGPIHHETRDTTNRYEVDESSGIPASAAAPGGGAKVRRLSGDQVADAVIRCIDRRSIEIILPNKTRLLMAIDSFFPSLADRILRSKTGSS